MKKLIIFLIGAIVLASCSTPKKLYDKGIKKIEKAIERDSTLVFPLDTIVDIQYDTIPGIDGKDSIIRIKETIEIPCDFDIEAFKEQTRNKSRRELRYERKMYKDSLKHDRKMYRLETNRLKDSLNYLKQQNRQLTKQLDDKTDTEVKLAKEETKRQKCTWFVRVMGRFWWIPALIAFVLGYIIRGYIPNIFSIFKKHKDDGLR